MTKLAVIFSLAISSGALATSLELTPKNSGQGQAFVYTGGIDQATIRIDGEAARVLYAALEALPQGSFGFIQTQTKTTDKAQCVQSILGDIPGQMSKASYACTILVDKK